MFSLLLLRRSFRFLCPAATRSARVFPVAQTRRQPAVGRWLALVLVMVTVGWSRAASIKDFGAVGDGVADDTRAIQAALDAATIVVVPEGVYRITNALRPRGNQQIELNGTIKVSDAHIQPLTADVAAGQPRVPVRDASGFYAGQWVTLGDEGLPIQGGGKNKVRREAGDCGRIAKIEGNTLVMELNLRRSYTLRGKARIGTQPSALLITQSNVHIRGRGVIDGNKAGQFDFAPGDMTVSKGRGEDTRAGCGISIDSDPGAIADFTIEGITVRDAILHNISLYRVRNASIVGVNCIGAHDKNILLRLSEDCRLLGNRCVDSSFEDGIIIYSGNRHCVIQGNICTGNARMGICVNAFQPGILLAGNICRRNPLNFSIRGDNGSSTGDFSAEGRVNIEGRGNVIQGLIALGSVSLSATDVVFEGGTISGEEGKLLPVGLSIARNSTDRRVALVDRVQIRGLNFRHCQTGVRVSGVVKEVRIVGNNFKCEGPAIVVADEAKSEVSVARNEGFATEGSGVATIPAGARRVSVAHGLQLAPRLEDITVTPASAAGAAARWWIAAPTTTGFDLLLAAPVDAPAEFVWTVGASRR
jgi:hypothetical protein